MTLLNVLTVALGDSAEWLRLAPLGYKRPMYDFVYMPWAKLAIVNFVDHESCQAKLFQSTCAESSQALPSALSYIMPTGC